MAEPLPPLFEELKRLQVEAHERVGAAIAEEGASDLEIHNRIALEMLRVLMRIEVRLATSTSPPPTAATPPGTTNAT